jgi:hypothetical protein
MEYAMAKSHNGIDKKLTILYARLNLISGGLPAFLYTSLLNRMNPKVCTTDQAIKIQAFNKPISKAGIGDIAHLATTKFLRL